MAAMQRLHAGAGLLQGLALSAVEAAAQTSAQAARTFFMPLCLTATAMMGRVQVVAGNLAGACATAYNALSALLPLLPEAADLGSAGAEAHTQRLARMPRSLQCKWGDCCLPQVVPLVLDEVHQQQQQPAMLAAWLPEQAAALWDELGLMRGLHSTVAQAAAQAASSDGRAATAAAGKAAAGIAGKAVKQAPVGADANKDSGR